MTTKRIALPMLCALAVIVLIGCEDFTKDKPKATINGPTETPPAEGSVAPAETTPPPEAAAATVYKLTEETSIDFEGSKTIDTHVGGFENIEGTITIPSDNPEKAVIEVVIDMTSTYSDNRLLTTVLKGDDFFNIAKYPTSTFKSSKIEKTADGYNITGTLDLRGVAKSITFPATVKVSEDRITAEAEFVVDRSWWNVGYADWKGELIKNEVLLVFAVDAALEQ